MIIWDNILQLNNRMYKIKLFHPIRINLRAGVCCLLFPSKSSIHPASAGICLERQKPLVLLVEAFGWGENLKFLSFIFCGSNVTSLFNVRGYFRTVLLRYVLNESYGIDVIMTHQITVYLHNDKVLELFSLKLRIWRNNY